jgi:hypothetical protein
MTEAHDNNNEDHSSEAVYSSKRDSQNKELSKVLETLESLGFGPLDHHEN